MLSVKENERLTRVGPGSPMGELMRRYWHPVAAASELDENPTRAVRLLCESLVLYKDRSGTLGLLDEACAHRRMYLLHGVPEQHGLRCPYHGWLYDEQGRCLDLPAEGPDSTFKDRIRLKAYPVQELGGLVFAYLGPEPAPLLPRWDALVWDNVYRDIAFTRLDCNWLQCMEVSVDNFHLWWLHSYYSAYMKERMEADGDRALGVDSAIYAQQSVQDAHAHQESLTPEMPEKFDYDVFEHGIFKRQLNAGGSEEDASWKRGHPILMPNILRQAGGNMQWRVPVDDTHTLHVIHTPHIPPAGTRLEKQRRVPYYETPTIDSAKGWWVTDYILGQDFTAWVSQARGSEGTFDRHREKLVASDKGIILYRRLLQEQMKVVASGGEPMNVFREPHDFIPILTETEPGDTFLDPERNKRQAENVGAPPDTASERDARAARRAASLGSGHHRYSPQVISDVVAMYEKTKAAGT